MFDQTLFIWVKAHRQGKLKGADSKAHRERRSAVCAPSHLHARQPFQAFTSGIERMADWFVSVKDRGWTLSTPMHRTFDPVPAGRVTSMTRSGCSAIAHAGGCCASFRPGAALRRCVPTCDCANVTSVPLRLILQHMQKALTYINLQLHHVVTDVGGVTGMRIIRAIVTGPHDPDVLALL